MPSDTPAVRSCRVKVRRSDLWVALDCLAAKSNRSKTVRGSLRDGDLELARDVSAARVPATGTWSGVATVNAQFVKGLRLLREDYPDEVIIEATDSRINVGNAYSILCRWDSLAAKRR